jgi:hypothetical protein
MKLNVLTADNFDKIKFDLLDLAKTNKENCEKLVSSIIEKSWTELKFSRVYA